MVGHDKTVVLNPGLGSLLTIPCSVEPNELETPCPVSGKCSPDERVVERGFLYPCHSRRLIVIKLFKPKRKITIILVCAHLLQGEAPFLQWECRRWGHCPRQPGCRSWPGRPGWTGTLFGSGVWDEGLFGMS